MSLYLSLAALALCSVSADGAPPDREVVVVNDASSPVPVASRLVGERRQYRFVVTVPSGQAFNCLQIPVAAGKRLIINQISGDVRLPVGERGVVLVTSGPITAFPGGVDATITQHFFPLTSVGMNISVGPHAQNHYFNEQPEIWSDVSVGVCISRGPTPSPLLGEAAGLFAVSGRMVDLPE